MRVKLLSIIYTATVKVVLGGAEIVQILLPYLKIVTGKIDAPCLEIVKEGRTAAKFRAFYLSTLISKVTYIILRKLEPDERKMLIKEINKVLEGNIKKSEILTKYGINKLESKYLYWIVNPRGKNVSILIGLERDVVRKVVDETLSFISTCIDYVRRDQIMQKLITNIQDTIKEIDLLKIKVEETNQALNIIADILDKVVDKLNKLEQTYNDLLHRYIGLEYYVKTLANNVLNSVSK